ncbi:MAG: DUF2946 family protein [Rhodoferax sp.]
MDDIVRQAMAKWPRVPSCYGWLGLDARGDWYMRDDRTQALGGFASGVPGAKGSRLRHDKLMAFIGRNYEVQPDGCWYFQNGPQRVYVELECTPWVWRVDAQGAVQAHTGVDAGAVRACLVDEAGRVYLHTALGFGLVHSQDVVQVDAALERADWVLEEVAASGLAQRFAYVTSPQAQAGAQPG